VKAVTATYPNIATATDTSEGPGLTIMLYGFPPNTSVTLGITGPSNNVPSARNVDQYGTYLTFLDSRFAQGSYTITATWSGGSVSASAAKISSDLDPVVLP